MYANDLLRLLEQANPGRSQADLLVMLNAIPDAKARNASHKPAGRRVGSRPRADASMERRRSWASSGRLPPKIAARFTLAEHAVLAVIATEIAGKGECTLTLEHIAALTGVCRTSVKNALREAHRLGFVRIEVRRITAWRNAPNRVTIISPEWSSWLKLRRKGGGVKFLPATNTNNRKQAEAPSTPNVLQGFRSEEVAHALGRAPKASMAPASRQSYATSDRGVPPEPRVDVAPAKIELPRVPWQEVHGHAQPHRS